MPTPKELIEELQGMDPDEPIAYSLWSTEDVQGAARDHLGKDIELTQDEICDVLESVHADNDCEYGINWQSFYYALDMNVMAREK